MLRSLDTPAETCSEKPNWHYIRAFVNCHSERAQRIDRVASRPWREESLALNQESWQAVNAKRLLALLVRMTSTVVGLASDPHPIRAGNDAASQQQKQQEQDEPAPNSRAGQPPPKAEPVLQPIKQPIQKRQLEQSRKTPWSISHIFLPLSPQENSLLQRRPRDGG